MNVAGNSNLDCVDKVGMVERRIQFDGKETTTILPAVIYHKKPIVSQKTFTFGPVLNYLKQFE